MLNKQQIIQIKYYSFIDKQQDAILEGVAPPLDLKGHSAMILDKIEDNYYLVAKFQTYSQSSLFFGDMNEAIDNGNAFLLKPEDGVLRNSYINAKDIHLVNESQIRNIGQQYITDEAFFRTNALIAANHTLLMNKDEHPYFFNTINNNLNNSIINIEQEIINNIDTYNQILGKPPLSSNQNYDLDFQAIEEQLNQLPIANQEISVGTNTIKSKLYENSNLLNNNQHGYVKEVKDYINVYNEYNNMYINNLQAINDEQLIAFFDEKGITSQLIEEYEIGYCINQQSDNFYEAIKDFNYEEVLDNINLSDAVGDYQLLNEHITIPIKNEYNETIGFYGIDINNNTMTSRLVSPNGSNEPMLDKSNTIFNINNVDPSSNVYITDNPLDAIILEQQGMDNCISIINNNITEAQIQLLEANNISNVTIMAKNEVQAINLGNTLYNHNINVEVVLIPTQYQDLNNFLLKSDIHELNLESQPYNEYIQSINTELSQIQTNNHDLVEQINNFLDNHLTPKIDELQTLCEHNGLDFNKDLVYDNINFSEVFNNYDIKKLPLNNHQDIDEIIKKRIDNVIDEKTNPQLTQMRQQILQNDISINL